MGSETWTNSIYLFAGIVGPVMSVYWYLNWPARYKMRGALYGLAMTGGGWYLLLGPSSDDRGGTVTY